MSITTPYIYCWPDCLISKRDQNFTAGTVHGIARVLTLPENVSTTLVNAKPSSLYGLLNATNLLEAVDALRDVTNFAPNNAAFQAVS
jgi:uncharacterized surface protein with fasciclin (FAS1) repeats